jgi:hypothetical protein
MIIDHVHIAGIGSIETKNDPPVAGDADRPVTGKIAL